MLSVFSFVLPSVSYLLGKELINSAIKDTAGTTYGMIQKFIDHPDIYMVLTSLDTKALIERVEKTLNTIHIKENELNHENPLCIVLNQIHQKMCDIIDNLSKIKYYASEDKKKWFRRVRKSSYTSYLEQLKVNHNILDKRISYFFELLKVEKKLNFNTECKYDMIEF